MPDLKRICKPCPQVKDSIKPRKVINRLPDVKVRNLLKGKHYSVIDKTKDFNYGV